MITELSDAVLAALAEARAQLEREPRPVPRRPRRELPDDDPVVRTLRQLRASRGFVKRSRP